MSDLGKLLLTMGEANPDTPCPGCGKDSISDCGFGEYDYRGDFDCTHEDAENRECPCDLTHCEECRKEKVKS